MTDAQPPIDSHELRLQRSDGSWTPYRPAQESKIGRVYQVRQERQDSDRNHARRYKRDLWADDAVTTVSVDDAKEILAAVRKRADGWRNGVAGTLALVFGAFVLKSRGDGIGNLPVEPKALVIGTFIISTVLALWSLYRMLRAANGPSWLDTTLMQTKRPYDAERYLNRAAGAAHDLKIGQVLWLASVVLYFATVVLTWVLPTT